MNEFDEEAMQKSSVDDAGPSDAKPNAGPAKPKQKKNAPAKVAPRLSAYFGTKPVPAAAFVTAVRAAGFPRFPDEDIAGSVELQATNDPDKYRLVRLAAQPNLPPPLTFWLWPLVQAALRSRLPELFAPHVLDANVAFRRLLSEVGDQLKSESKEVRRSAEILLLLGVSWFAKRSTFDPQASMQLLAASLFKDDHDAVEAVIEAISGGDFPRLRSIAATVGMGKAAVQDANARADRENERRIKAEDDLMTARTEIGGLRTSVEALTAEREDLASRLAASERRFEERQQHWGTDMASTTARQKLILSKKIAPLLDDAVDALKEEPIFPDVALERLREALTTIKEAVQ